MYCSHSKTIFNIPNAGSKLLLDTLYDALLLWKDRSRSWFPLSDFNCNYPQWIDIYKNSLKETETESNNDDSNSDENNEETIWYPKRRPIIEDYSSYESEDSNSDESKRSGLQSNESNNGRSSSENSDGSATDQDVIPGAEKDTDLFQTCETNSVTDD